MSRLLNILALSAALVACGSATSHSIGSFQKPFGLKLNSTTLGAVQKLWGPARTFDVPESHSDFGICYKTENGGPIVVFLSNREFGGNDKLLLGVAIHARNTLDYQCSTSPYHESELAIGPIKLGMTIAEMESLIAADEVSAYENTANFFFQRRRQLTIEETRRFEDQFGENNAPDGADVVLGVWGAFVDGQTESIGVWQEESY